LDDKRKAEDEAARLRLLQESEKLKKEEEAERIA